MQPPPSASTFSGVGGCGSPAAVVEEEWAPKWLKASERRFNASACIEDRSWRQVLADAKSGATPWFKSGGLGSLKVSNHFGVWACFSGHACLSAVGASATDRMCYVFDQIASKFHPWGLNSELQLCDP